MNTSQLAKVDALLSEKQIHLAEGNEYYAMLTDRDLWEACSLARLIHKAPSKEV